MLCEPVYAGWLVFQVLEVTICFNCLFFPLVVRRQFAQEKKILGTRHQEDWLPCRAQGDESGHVPQTQGKAICFLYCNKLAHH